MTPLAGPGYDRVKGKPHYWLLAGAFALSLHVALAAVYIWRPSTPPPDIPAAAPMAIELLMQVAAPAETVTDVPPGPEQVESVKTPAPPEVVEEKLPELPVVEKPAEVVIRKPVAVEQPKQEREPDPEPEQPVEEVSEVAAPETTAMPSMDVARTSDQMAAPIQGALSQRDIDARQQWQGALQAHLERRKRYPRQAQSMRRQGMPTVTFSMDREGRVLSVELQQGSGVHLLDREAVALIRRAEPLPRPPAEVPGDPITLTLPIIFSM